MCGPFVYWMIITDIAVARAKQALERKEDEIQAARQLRNKLEDDKDAAELARATAAIEYAEHIQTIHVAHAALLEANICLVEAQSDVKGLKDRCSEITQALDDESKNVEAAQKEQDRLKTEAEEASGALRELLSHAENHEKRQGWEALVANKSVEDIDNEISAEEDKLELIRDANPNIMRDFERRGEEVRRLKQKLEAKTATLEALGAEISEVMNEWEPKLDALISKVNDAFAYNFEQINCAGEVRVHKDEDFEQWALEIMVKFR
jgi:structural maintenance of chromosomes protein 5